MSAEAGDCGIFTRTRKRMRDTLERVLAPETREGLELAITAFKNAGASVTTDAGFAEMKSTAKATWEPPLPVAIENCHGDMQAMPRRLLERSGCIGMQRVSCWHDPSR